jgi:hypothetical protein
MSSDTEAVSTEEVLTDQQRIEKLEKAARLNRLLIFALGGALLLTLIAWLLVALLGSSKAEEKAEEQAQLASMASVEVLQKEVAALQLQAGTLQQLLKDQQKLMLAQAQQQMAPSSSTEAPPAAEEAREQDRENVRMLARTLIGQEHNYQHTLNALKEGMRELAGMTPGSRSWLDFYEESLAKPMADSQARVKALQKWSGEQTQ